MVIAVFENTDISVFVCDQHFTEGQDARQPFTFELFYMNCDYHIMCGVHTGLLRKYVTILRNVIVR